MNEGTLDKTKRETDELHIIPAGHCWLECSRACVVWNNRADRFYQRSGKGCVTGLNDFSCSISKQWCVLNRKVPPPPLFALFGFNQPKPELPLDPGQETQNAFWRGRLFSNELDRKYNIRQKGM